MTTLLLVIAILVILALAGAWVATRNPARDRALARATADNLAMRQAIAQIRARVTAGSDADPELQVIADILGTLTDKEIT